jgi:lipopolysaccharide export system permease protein
MIKIIDLYILKRFCTRIIFLLVAISSIILITNLVEMIDNFIDAEMTSADIFNYYLLTIPMIISYAIPMSVTISSVLAILVYINNNELIAIRSLGVSYLRLIRVMVLVSILISISHFYFENNIISESNRLKNQIVKKYNLKKQKTNRINNNNFIEDADGKSIIIMNYNNKKQIAYNITIKEIKQNNIINRIDAKEMKWNDKDNLWVFKELLERKWIDNILQFNKTINDTSFSFKNINPIYLTSEFIEPEEMNYYELKDFISIKKNNSANTNKWEVGLHHKLSYALSSLILSITAILSSFTLKKSNVSYGIGLSLLIITAYYVLIIIGKNLGIEGIISPFLSAWLANFSLLILAGYLYKKNIF